MDMKADDPVATTGPPERQRSRRREVPAQPVHHGPGRLDSERLLAQGPRALAGETGGRIPVDDGAAGAEGATAPETLRQKDRDGIRTLESRPGDARFRRRSKAGLPAGISQA